MTTPAPQNETPGAAPVTRKKRRWLIWLFGFFLLVAAAMFWVWIKLTEPYLWGFGPRDMAVAQYTPKDVVGDLGGMKVTIPRHIPELVEYNGDPGWGEKRKGPRPERTHDSKIMSFGFDVRYPDMATLSSPEMWADKKAQKTFETMWLDVGVRAGEIYPRDGAMDSRTRYTIDEPAASRFPWTNRYTELPKKEFGLTVYSLQDINPKTNHPARQDMDAVDVFIDRNSKGQVTTFIDCRVHFKFSGACNQNFSMEYDGVKALIRVSYQPELRVHWRDIQAKVTQMILSFKASPDSIATSVTPQFLPLDRTNTKN
jgi:hypothetical protein